MRRVEPLDYGRELFTFELEQFREYYIRHRYGRYQMINNHINYQWVYPSWVVTRADRRAFDTYYKQRCGREQWGRELSETEKIEFQQYFVEKGGIYKYKYSREAYLKSFTLDRATGGNAYQWTWDGVENIPNGKDQETTNIGNINSSEILDKKVYGSVGETDKAVDGILPQNSTISKDRGDQPPQVYEEVEAESDIDSYTTPKLEYFSTVKPLIPVAPLKSEEGQTTYHRRYEHKFVSNQLIPAQEPNNVPTSTSSEGHPSSISVEDNYQTSSDLSQSVNIENYDDSLHSESLDDQKKYEHEIYENNITENNSTNYDEELESRTETKVDILSSSKDNLRNIKMETVEPLDISHKYDNSHLLNISSTTHIHEEIESDNSPTYSSEDEKLELLERERQEQARLKAEDMHREEMERRKAEEEQWRQEEEKRQFEDEEFQRREFENRSEGEENEYAPDDEKIDEEDENDEEDGNEEGEAEEDQDVEEDDYSEIPPDDYINDQRKRLYRSHRGRETPQIVKLSTDLQREVAIVQEINNIGNNTDKSGLWNRMKSKAKHFFG